MDVVRRPLRSGTGGSRMAEHATGRGVDTGPGAHRLPAVRARARYLCVPGERQDHVLFQLLDEPGMR